MDANVWLEPLDSLSTWADTLEQFCSRFPGLTVHTLPGWRQVAGGHGAVWDFPENKNIQRITAAIYENGGGVGAVCHGPAALVNVKLSDGSKLLSGKKTAVFTNAEEEAVGLTEVVPFLLQTEVEKAGATVETTENFTENAIRDGLLVTGQNPASATKSAELLVEVIEK